MAVAIIKPNFGLLLLPTIVVSTLLTACANEPYIAKPLDPAKTAMAIQLKNPLNADFKRFLLAQGYAEKALPFAYWGLHELTLSALYFNPQLDVAKAKLALAQARIDTAGRQQLPMLSGNIARSNRANNDIRPFSYGLNVEIPIQTNNKREINIELAQQQRDAAHLDVAQVAWQLRHQIVVDLTRYHENIALQKDLSQQLDTQKSIFNMLEKRFNAGLIDRIELNRAQQLALQLEAEIQQKQLLQTQLRAALATSAGLTLENFDVIAMQTQDVTHTLQQQNNALNPPNSYKTLQQSALLNRLDVRRSLAQYAAAETNIKLEVAKQTPDITLTPGFAFDFGDKIWSLGFASLLNLLQKNPTLINEATRLRDIEGAQFEALQNQIMGDLSQQFAHYQSAFALTAQAEQRVAQQTQHLQAVKKQFNAGLIDRLALNLAMQSLFQAQTFYLQAQFDQIKAANALENIIQYPLYDANKWPNLADNTASLNTNIP